MQSEFFGLKVFDSLREEDQGYPIVGIGQQLVEMSQVAFNLSTPDAHTAVLPSTHGCPSVQLTKTHLRGFLLLVAALTS